jgi:hypothetical protein
LTISYLYFLDITIGESGDGMIEDEIDKVLNKNFTNKKPNPSNSYKQTHNTIQKQSFDPTNYVAKKPTTIIQKLTAVAVVLLLFSVATIGLWSPYLMRQNPIQATEQENTAYATRFSDDSFFSIIVLPDTQFYSRDYPEIFINQTQWIVDNKETLNIVYVAHEGDIVANYNDEDEWESASYAMGLLENPATTNLQHGIAYSVVAGNHDQGWQSDLFNQYFSVNRFTGREYYGGSYLVDCNMNNYVLFDAYGLEFIAIGINHGPNPDELTWANSILSQYSNRRALLITHGLIDSTADWFLDYWCNPQNYDTSQIYESLKHNQNLFMMLCGHVHPDGEARRTDTYNDNTIHSILANYQDYEDGGNGFLRIMTFYPSEDTIHVQTYSPWLDEYRTGDQSEFTLDYSMEILPPENPLEKPGWELVFHDEFSAGALNTTVWKTDVYYHCSATHWEPQYYTNYSIDYRYIGPYNLPIGKRDSNFVFNAAPDPAEGGSTPHQNPSKSLSLVYRKEPGLKYFPAWMWFYGSIGGGPLETFTQHRGFYYMDDKHPTDEGGLKDAVYGPMNDTSAWMHTNNELFTYGYFEIRCKVPNKGLSLWPAFWLYAGSGKRYREIDIAEFWFYEDNKANTPGFAMHLENTKRENKYTYSSSYTLTGPYENVSDHYHTYAVRWTPNVVVWYVDNVERWRVSGDSPYLGMYIIANLAADISDWKGGINPDKLVKYQALELPMEMEIDYIRAYRSLEKEFLTQWINLSYYDPVYTGNIGQWDISENDYYVNGDFSAGEIHDGVDRLFAINTEEGVATLLQYCDDSWVTIWENEKTGRIGTYTLNADHNYEFYAGKFTGSSKDELLVINKDNGDAALLKLIYYQNRLTWETLWESEQSPGGELGIITGERVSFTIGDLTGDGKDEVYISNSETYAARLVQFKSETNSWVILWKDTIGKSIHNRFGDVQLTGDFTGNGKDLFLSVDTEQKTASLYEFTGSGWNQLWNNADTGKIYWWNIGSDDDFISGDFTGDGQDELMAFARNGWAHLMTFRGIQPDTGSPFQWKWGNEGSKSINRWEMTHEFYHPPFEEPAEKGRTTSIRQGWTQISYPRYLSGYFKQDSHADLFCVNAGFGWAHLATYTELP